MARQTRTFRLLGIGLVVLALLIALYTAVAYIGLQRGRSLREERLQEQRTEELANQLSRAREDIANGNFSLASRRLEWILAQEPTYPEAQTLLEEAEGATNGTRQRVTPSGDEGDPTETPESVSTPASREEEAAAATLRDIEDLLEDEAWEDAITALISFQHNNPEYERRHTDELLQEAYMAQGVELLYGDQIELGLYYLEQAQQLGDLPQDVRDQQQWAELYLAGIGYFGVNWDVTLFYFRDLCLAAPFFHDACAKLNEALVAYGDQYAVQRDWCPAEALYQEASQQNDSNALLQKLREAREGCASATPTSSAPISGTLPVTGTTSLTQTQGLPAGRNLERP